MQVYTIPPPTPFPASSTSEPVVEVARAPAHRKDAAPSGKLEQALIQAAGLDPVQAAHVQVALSVDSGTHQVVAKLIDEDTGDVIRQFPAEQILRNAALLTEFLGAAFNDVA